MLPPWPVREASWQWETRGPGPLVHCPLALRPRAAPHHRAAILPHTALYLSPSAAPPVPYVRRYSLLPARAEHECLARLPGCAPMRVAPCASPRRLVPHSTPPKPAESSAAPGGWPV